MEVIKLRKEKDTFENYFNKFYPQIYKYILKKITNVQDAEDLTMACFAACWEKFDQFDPEKASFQTWLYVVVNNKLKNYYRDKKSFDDIDDVEESVDGFEDSVLAAEYLKYMRDNLADALKTLNDVQKAIIIYKYYENKNSSEIAFLVGLTPGNVRVQLTRATKKLREYFDNNNIKWDI